MAGDPAQQSALLGRHALVCGGSQGIGFAAASALAARGAEVTLLARGRDRLAAALAALPRAHAGQQHAAIAADLADHATLEAKVAAATQEQPVTILVNNGGGPPGGALVSAQAAEFRTAFERHLLAAQTLVRLLLPGMRAAGWGRIVNVLSISVREPLPNLGVSNSVRAAMASWAKTLATEVAPQGITVNNVLPGYTRTRRLEQVIRERAAARGSDEANVAAELLGAVPLGRFVAPEEVAAAIAFFASPAAGAITGTSLAVDGGLVRSL